MKVAVIGSREFCNYAMVKDYLDRLNKQRKITLIVSGGAAGADSLGKRWAFENGVSLLEYIPDWQDLSHPDARIKTNKYDKKYDANAGHRRNKTIIDDSDVILAFWNQVSPGTRNGIEYAQGIGKPIKIIHT